MTRLRWIAALLVAAGASGQTTLDLTRQGRLATGTALPAQCAVGQLFFKSNAAAGANLYACTAANTWTVESGSGGGGASAQLCTVSSSATPVFDAAQCSAFSLTLGSTQVTSSTLVNARPGQELTFIITQDQTGGRPFVWPTNVVHPCAVSTTANVSSTVSAIFDGNNANANYCTTTEAATLVTGPTRSAPGTPADGLACWFDAAGNTWKCKDGSGAVHAAVLTASGPTAGQFLTYIDGDGVPHAAQVGEAALSLADVTANDATSARHGFLPKLPGDGTKCFLGDGTYGACGSGIGNANDVSAPVACQAAGGSGSAYTCSLTPALPAYAAGAKYRFRADVANTGAATVNFNSLGAKNITKIQGGIATALAANDIRAGQWVELIYDGTEMQMTSQVSNAASVNGVLNSQTGSTYTLTSDDNGKVLTFNNAGTVTLNVPAGLGAGFNCLIVQSGAGAVVPTAVGTTIRQRQSFTKTAGQYAVATLVAYSPDVFVLSGDLQ